MNRAPPKQQKNAKRKNVPAFPKVSKMRCAHVAIKRTDPQSTILARLFAVSLETEAV